MHLFIDTTDKITIGLLSKDWKWVEYFNDPDVVISSKLHSYIYSFLNKHDLEITQLDSLVYCAGPGSYTGMRVAEGIADLIDWNGMNIHSFYHFEVPKMLNIGKGVWFANAFKGEKFLFTWDQKTEVKTLIKNEEFNKSLDGFENKFSHVDDPELEALSTTSLIKNKSEEFFPLIQSRRELFYYRELEQEFQKC